MPSITTTDLTNAKLDVDHIAAIATSTSITATDRLGNIKDTIAGAVYKIAGITNRGAWVTATVYATKDIVTDSGTWYVCVVAHTSGATFAGDSSSKWRVYQGVTSGDLAASSGAGLVGDIADGVGAVQTTVQAEIRKLSTKVWRYGAVGDGIADDTIAINNANLATPFGGRLEFEAGKTYKTSGTITLDRAVEIIGNGATIKPAAAFYAAGGDAVVLGKLIGTYSAFAPFAVTATLKTVILPAGVVAVEGDVIFFGSSDIRLADAISNYLHGQWAIVGKVVGQNIVISTPFYGSFNVNVVQLYRGYPRMGASNLTLDMSNSSNTYVKSNGLAIVGSNIYIDNCKFIGNQYAMTGATVTGENAVVENCYVSQFQNIQGLPLPGRVGYGIFIGANNAIVRHNTLVDNKHGISAGPREFSTIGLTYDNNLVSENVASVADAYTGSLDVHCNVSGRVIISNNYIVGYSTLLFVRNKKALITGNTLIQTGAQGVAIQGSEQGFDGVVIDSNKAFLFNADSNLFGAYNGTNECKNVTLTNNYADVGSLFRLYSDAVIPAVVKNVKIHNNTLENGHTACKFTGASFSIDGLSVSGNQLKNCRSLFSLVTDSALPQSNISVTNNIVSGSGTDDIVYFGSATAISKTTTFNNVAVSDNMLNHSATVGSGYVMKFESGVFNGLVLAGNICNRVDGNAWSANNTFIRRGDFTDLHVTNNVFDTDLNLLGDGVNSSLSRMKFSGNRLRVLGLQELTTNLPFVDCSITNNCMVGASFIARSGSTSWAGSNELNFANNRVTEESATGLFINSFSTGHKIKLFGNMLGKKITNSSGTYYGLPIGNSVLTGTAIDWNGGTTVGIRGELYKSAAPTTGTWAINDRVFNSAPSVGQPKSWVCTVAGTPGTWVSEGNL